MTHLTILLMGQGFTPNLDGITGPAIAFAAIIVIGACLKVLFK